MTLVQPNHFMSFDAGMDPESAALITQLALQDLEQVASSSKGKLRSNAPLTDAEYAYQLQSQNYQEWFAMTADMQYAQSLGVAMDTDAPFLEAAIVADAAAAEDRRVAEMLARGEELPPPTAVQARLEQPDFTLFPNVPSVNDAKGKKKDTGKYKEESMHSDTESLEGDLDFDENATMLATFRARHAQQTRGSGPGSSGASKPTPSTNVQCIICNDGLKSHQALHTACNHYYCRTCVTSLVETFTHDESLFPLRCCKEPIPIHHVDPYISSALRTLFLKKHAEFTVVSKDRVYCSSSACSAFLGSSQNASATGTGSIVCPECTASTCLRCKQTAHPGDDCAANAATVQVRALARQQGWQTCPDCAAVVELSIGCYHMTCRCRSEFCYLCAAKWKSCECPQWDEDRLTEAAQHHVENDLGVEAVRRMAPDVLHRQVQRRVDMLRYDHDCERHTWKQRVGGGNCETCNQYLPGFLKICKHCSIVACVRCTRNRL